MHMSNRIFSIAKPRYGKLLDSFDSSFSNKTKYRESLIQRKIQNQ